MLIVQCRKVRTVDMWSLYGARMDSVREVIES